MYTSLWGVDGRFGGGLVVFIVLLLVTIVSRTFIEGEKDVRSVLLVFLIGFAINNFLSLLSFFGINIWGFLPVYRNLYQVGLPLLRSSKIHLLVNFVNVILCIGFIGEYLINGKRQLEFILSLLFGILSMGNIWLYSINQSLAISLSFVAILVVPFLFILKGVKLEKETSKQIFLFILICVFLIAIPMIFLQVPKIRTALLTEDFQTFTEVGLGFDISWIITGSVIVSSLVRALFGFGLGTYSIAYNRFKPLDEGLLSLGDVTFHTAVNEVLTKLANGGLIWFLVWSFLGYLIIKAFISDLKGVNNSSKGGDKWRFLMVDLVIVMIFLSSFLISYSVLVLFLLLAFVSLRSVIGDYSKKSVEEKFVLKFWALNMTPTPKGDRSLYGFNIFLTILVSVLALFFVGILGSRGLASLHTLRAESFIIQENRKYDGETAVPTIEDREVFLDSVDDFYLKAINFDKNNPLYNRKRALIMLEKIRVLVERFSEVDEEDSELRDQYITTITELKSVAIDLSRKSTDISPSIYSNWLTRSTVYTSLVGVGFEEHIPDALSSLDRAVSLNPLNFQLYYSMAQVYIVKGEQENALGLLGRVLEINPQHIPSILLAADLYKEAGNTEAYASYLQAAQQILENEEATDLDIYGEIVKALEALQSEGVDLEEIEEPELENEDLEGVEAPQVEEEPAQEPLLDPGLEEDSL
jgi:tetratricopeptide (TPR) repeat protein